MDRPIIDTAKATTSHTLVSGESLPSLQMDAGGRMIRTSDSTVTTYCMVLLFAQFSKFMLILFLVKLNQQHK